MQHATKQQVEYCYVVRKVKAANGCSTIDFPKLKELCAALYVMFNELEEKLSKAEVHDPRAKALGSPIAF